VKSKAKKKVGPPRSPPPPPKAEAVAATALQVAADNLQPPPEQPARTEDKPRDFGAKKTAAGITRAEFRSAARPLRFYVGGEERTVEIDGRPTLVLVGAKGFDVPVKYFSTGSLGWYCNQKLDVTVGGKTVTAQGQLNLAIVNSKDLPPEPSEQPGAN
jgi:hypothetical protein